MAIGALRNLPMLFMAFGAGNPGMLAWRGCPDFIDLIMAGAACCLSPGLVGNRQRPVHRMAGLAGLDRLVGNMGLMAFHA